MFPNNNINRQSYTQVTLNLISHFHTFIMRVILLLPGSFCPIHNEHIAVMEEARRQVLERGDEVVGGYLLPSSDDWVGGKVGHSYPLVPLDRRVELCRMALADAEWITVLDWGWASGNRAAVRLAEEHQVHVLIVAGSDTSRRPHPEKNIVLDRGTLSSTRVRAALLANRWDTVEQLCPHRVACRLRDMLSPIPT